MRGVVVSINGPEVNPLLITNEVEVNVHDAPELKLELKDRQVGEEVEENPISLGKVNVIIPF